MKKRRILLLYAFIVIVQQLSAQGDPGLLTNFKIEGNSRTGYSFNWTISVNEAVTSFILEKSDNGWDFKDIASISVTSKKGVEKYHYHDTITNAHKIMYRLKMLTRGQTVYYSKIITYQAEVENINHLKVFGITNNILKIGFNTASNQTIDLQVFSMAGFKVASQKITSSRNNIVFIPISLSLSPGIYIVYINDGLKIQTTKFIKQYF